MKFEEKVKKLLDEALEADNSLFLIDFSIGQGNVIKVVIDGDNGVSINDCISVSRAIEHNLDREEEDFSLEVTSYGISLPLRVPRQYVKNIGRILKVELTDGTKLEGEVLNATDQEVVMAYQVREPKPIGKGKITVTKEQIIALSNIVEAKVIITF